MIGRTISSGLRRVLLASALAATPPLATAPASAQTTAVPSVITVEGQAMADLAPDAADLSVDVEAERPTPTAASAEVARVAQAVAEAIKADGIEAKDVSTRAIVLTPIYPDDSGSAGGASHAPKSFRAATVFALTIRPPERAGVVAAHLVDKGATGIDDLTFTASQRGKVMDDLRAEAMRDARRKALIYVQALGLTLGRVLEINPQEEGFAAPRAVVARAAKSIMAAPTPAMPVEPGELHLQAGVSVRFAIAD